MQKFLRCKNFFNEEKDICKGRERIYTYTDKNIGHFVRQSVKGSEIGAFNQISESPKAQNFFKNTIEELKLFTNTICQIIDHYMKYLDEMRKRHEEEHSEKFDDYRQLPPKEMEKCKNEKLSELPISKKSTSNMDLLLMDFDANV